MEGAQKIDIPLQSPLDVKSSDMLVPVSSPKFQHNRQQFQGQYLPSSVRFEHDGWAAGNSVYQFEIDEVSVKAGRFTVSKQLINSKPLYAFVFRDTDGNKVGSLYYVPSSRHLDGDTVTIEDVEKTTITGSINGKPFVLDADPILNTVMLNEGTHKDIQLNSAELKSDYTTEIVLQDKAATVDLAFDGIHPPSKSVYNGSYLVGNFTKFSSEGSFWGDEDTVLQVASEGDDILLYMRKGDSLIKKEALVQHGKGVVSANFEVPLDFLDRPQVSLQEIVPFVKDLSLSVPSSKVSNTAADVDFNKWVGSLHGSDGSDRLYRNVCSGKGTFDGNYNKQVIEHTIPLWFGITADAHTVSESGDMQLLFDEGDVVAKADIFLGEVYDISGSTSLVPAEIWAECTAKVKAYSSKVSFTSGAIHVWEGSVDKADSYCHSAVAVSDGDSIVQNVYVSVRYSTKKYIHLHSSDIDEAVTVYGTWTFTLSTAYTNLSEENIREMIHVKRTAPGKAIYFTIEDIGIKVGGVPEYVYDYDDDGEVIEGSGHFVSTDNDSIYEQTSAGKSIYEIDLSKSPFYAGYNARVIIDGDTVTIEPPEHVKGAVTKFSNSKVHYAQELKSSTRAFWGVCCMAKVASSVYIKSEEILTPALDSTCFGVEKAAISSNSYVDAGNLFTHQVVQASCQDSFSMGVSLVALDSAQRIFYTDTAPSDSDMYYLPEHFITGSLSTSGTSGNMQSYMISRSYSMTSADSEYTLGVTVNGNALKTKQGSFFTYISSVHSSIDTSELLSGNEFSFSTVYELLDSLQWSLGGLNFYMDFSKHSSDALDYLKDFGQSLSICTVKNGVVRSAIESSYSMQGTIPKIEGVLPFTDGNGTVWNIDVSSFAADSDSGGIAQNVPPVQHMQLSMHVPVSYSLLFQIPYLFNRDDLLVSLKDNVASVLVQGDRLLQIDFDTMQATLTLSDGNVRDCDEVWTDTSIYALQLTSEDIRRITLLVRGAYNEKNVSVASLSLTDMQVLIEGDTVAFRMSDLLNSHKKSSMRFLYTPVDRPELVQESFMKVETDKEYQFLRQQWSTTSETECFWWVDEGHVLVLDKSRFILRKKTDVLTDWDGDTFEQSAEWLRHDVLTSDVLRYFGTSAYAGQSARFVTVIPGKGSISLKVYDPLDDMDSFECACNLVTRELGTPLCPDNRNMYTYSTLVLDNLVSQSKWTATCIDDYLIVGIHYDNNFNQWAVVIDISTHKLVKVIQGYGFVGVNGLLTGGEIPERYFDVSVGFTGTVQSLSALADKSYNISSLSELFTVTDMIVGNDSQQWYVSKCIPSIVSHITYSKGSFHVCSLPLNNNYAVNYDSASYMSTVFGDLMFYVRSFKDLMPESNAAWNVMLAFFGYPMLYMLKPKISIANYLQQTLGQAAYVHYNSTSVYQSKDLTKESLLKNYSAEEAADSYDKSKEESAISSDELSFDRQSVKQSQQNKDPYKFPFSLLASSLVTISEWAQDELRVNLMQNQASVKDKGRKYNQNFLQNLNSMSIANMRLQSMNPVQTSEVTAIKTLDMFYSTSDKQNIAAGAGYVNHNFVAQCVAQSVTSVQAEFTQQRLIYLMGTLTLFQIEKIHEGLVAAREAVNKKIESNAGSGWTIGGLVVGASFTTVTNIALAIAWAALNVACAATKIALKILPDLLNSLGSGKITSSITGRLSKHIYDIEGKHKYGSRTECFMYPCFGIDTAQQIVDESVEVVTQNKTWRLSMKSDKPKQQVDGGQPSFVTANISDDLLSDFDGDIPYYIAMLKGKQKKVRLPEKMAYVIGAESFLPMNDFKNENIGESEPVFATPPFQDYIIDENWQLSQTASVGMTTWISCKDTKLIDGELSNCVISDEFCGVASPYAAIEVKRGIDRRYLRPYAITPRALALNQTGMNCCFEEKAYHAFDGYGYRIVNWCGTAGMNKEHQTWLYSFLVNDRFKRSNKLPQNEYLGNFKSDPVVAIVGDVNDRVYTLVTQPGEGKGMQAGTVGEDKDIRRYALPVFTEFVTTLPATVKTLSAQVMSVIDGVTSLTTENRDLQSAYKAPVSVDFAIGKNKYRYTNEYICALTQERGVTKVQDGVPCLGLTFVGADPFEAILYSPATRNYYKFTGGTSLQAVDTLERFRDVVYGVYDFINQEVIIPCLATFVRLDKKVLDDADETDNVIVPRLKDSKFIGEVPPPTRTICNMHSGFKTLSLPCGITYQGPNRCIINRFVVQDYMLEQIKSNYGLWKRVPREEYHPFRVYPAKYEFVDEAIGDTVKVKGWTHNPFLLVTSPLGTSESSDCLFEWEVTFHWSMDMTKLYNQKQYAVVNVLAETMSQGGKVVPDRPAHVFLTKELFTTTGNFGYYTYRYQSKCGTGNRERLHIWSDQYICISSLSVSVKPLTQKRTEQLTQQIDVQLLTEV